MKRPLLARCHGFTLLEILLALVILSMVAVGIAQLMLTSAQKARDAGAIGYRAAALSAEVARVTAAPPGTLVNGTTTSTVTAPPFPYTRTTVIGTTGITQTITITITPTGPRAIEPVTRTIQRITTCGANPFP